MNPMNQPVAYTTARATTAQILEHLRACSDQFCPPLDERVDLPTYAQKLFKHAINFEAWCGDSLVGLVAVYLNSERVPTTAFVSNVSVLSEFRSKGIGRQLLSECHREVSRQGAATISLEVSAENRFAIEWYSKIGYTLISGESETFEMRYELRLN